MYWIQNSSFEGELNEGQFKNLNKELKEVIKKEEDSILFFWAEHKKFISKKILGFEKNEVTNFF
jgi:CRISPR-associated protein Cas2